MPPTFLLAAGCCCCVCCCCCCAPRHTHRHLHTHLCISASGRGGHGSESVDKFSRLTIRFAILHTAVRPSVSSVLHVTQAPWCMVRHAPCGARPGASARCLCVRVSSSTRSATTPQLDLLPGVFGTYFLCVTPRKFTLSFVCFLFYFPGGPTELFELERYRRALHPIHNCTAI